MIFDISRRISTSTPVWTGDTPYQTQSVLKMADGASVNLTTITTTLHIATHADAYFHYTPGGIVMADMPLSPYLGRARVVTVSKTSGPLMVADLPDIDYAGGERLLIHSQASESPHETWWPNFVYPSPELIAHLAGLGYVLIGVDAPSFDAYDSHDLPGHNALRKHDMVNLENLYLHEIADGDYELIALPLKLDAACGSPVRAILRSLD